MADEKMVQNTVQPERNEHEEEEENDVEMNEDAEECNEEEYQALNAQLDQLHSALDLLESKNDNVYVELTKLLESNRETRKQIQESQMSKAAEETSK